MCQFLTNKNRKTFLEYENYYTEKHYTCLRREIDIIISNCRHACYFNALSFEI